MNKKSTRKAFNSHLAVLFYTKNALQKKPENIKNTISFDLRSNHTPRRFLPFTSRASSLIFSVGITGKSGPK